MENEILGMVQETNNDIVKIIVHVVQGINSDIKKSFGNKGPISRSIKVNNLYIKTSSSDYRKIEKNRIIEMVEKIASIRDIKSYSDNQYTGDIYILNETPINEERLCFLNI